MSYCYLTLQVAIVRGTIPRFVSHIKKSSADSLRLPFNYVKAFLF